MKKHCLLKRMSHCLTVVLMLAACGDNTAKKAEQLLQEARAHFERGELEAARADIDSLRQTYPNIVETRKGALRDRTEGSPGRDGTHGQSAADYQQRT